MPRSLVLPKRCPRCGSHFETIVPSSGSVHDLVPLVVRVRIDAEESSSRRRAPAVGISCPQHRGFDSARRSAASDSEDASARSDARNALPYSKRSRPSRCTAFAAASVKRDVPELLGSARRAVLNITASTDGDASARGTARCSTPIVTAATARTTGRAAEHLQVIPTDMSGYVRLTTLVRGRQAHMSSSIS